MKAVKIIFMAALLTSVAGSAFSQQRPAAVTQPGSQYSPGAGAGNSEQPGRGEPLTDEKRDEIRKKINTVRIWRLTEALKLDAGTSAKLSSLLSSVDQRRRHILREQTGTIRTLRIVVNGPKPDEANIKTNLEKLEKNHQAMQELIKSEMIGLKNILTIEQQARYIVFQHEFMHEMRGMIGGVHGNAGGAVKGSGQRQ
jgi:Spy/CpxP family protein refolding chaperone